jgi:regulator of replication initiation timing
MANRIEDEEDKTFKERQSQYKNWQDLKKQKDFHEYRRSMSKPGLWKNLKGDYRRAPSRTPSTPRKEQTKDEKDWNYMKNVEIKMRFVQKEVEKIMEYQDKVTEENHKLKNENENLQNKIEQKNEELKETQNNLEKLSNITATKDYLKKNKKITPKQIKKGK